MKPGFCFTNSNMELTVVHIREDFGQNVALLVQSGDCPYITVRDLSQEKNGNYTWAWGHYFSDFQAALIDYFSRS